MSELPPLSEPLVHAMLARSGITASVEQVVRHQDRVEVGFRHRDAVVIKVYAPKLAWQQAKEIYVYRLLAEHCPELTGRVPRVLRAEPAGNPTGHIYTVLSKVEGVPLADVDAQLTATQRHDVYQQIGRLLRAVHRVPMGGFGYIVTDILDPAASNQACMERAFERKLCEFAGLGGSAELVGPISRMVAEHENVLAVPVEPVLCHNDLHEGNVLVERDGDDWTVRGFVDVENATAGDPVLDLAKTEYRAIRGDAAKREGLLTGWASDRELPDDIEARLRIHRLYHALELWTWFAGIGEHQRLPGIIADLTAMVEQEWVICTRHLTQ